MSERWFHERTEDGWTIFGANRDIVATVHDPNHERECDAILLAAAPAMFAALEGVHVGALKLAAVLGEKTNAW